MGALEVFGILAVVLVELVLLLVRLRPVTYVEPMAQDGSELVVRLQHICFSLEQRVDRLAEGGCGRLAPAIPVVRAIFSVVGIVMVRLRL